VILSQIPAVDNPWMAVAVVAFFALQAWQLWVSSRNSKGISEVHKASDGRFTELQAANEGLRGELKALREQINLNLGTQAGTAAAAVQAAMPPHTNAGPTDRPYDPKREIYP
jgi:hypothetical protein